MSRGRPSVVCRPINKQHVGPNVRSVPPGLLLILLMLFLLHALLHLLLHRRLKTLLQGRVLAGRAHDSLKHLGIRSLLLGLLLHDLLLLPLTDAIALR